MKTRGASKRSTRKPKNNRQLVKTIKRVIHKQAELKEKYETVDFAVTASGQVYGLYEGPNGIDQGTGDDDRIGDQIRLKTLYVNVRIAQNGSSSPDVLRLIIFRWKPLNDPPAVDDILYTPAGTAFYTAMSQYVNKHSQYVILKDLYCNVGTNTNIRSYRWKINLRDIAQEYESTGSTMKFTNGLFVLAVSEDTALTTGMKISCRLTYYDI